MNADKKLIDTLVAEFEKHPTIEKAVLFGSRARGDNADRSDYDIAVYGDLNHSEKSTLRFFCNEDLPTLHKVDLVFMQEQCDSLFIDNIQKEGIKIYG